MLDGRDLLSELFLRVLEVEMDMSSPTNDGRLIVRFSWNGKLVERGADEIKIWGLYIRKCV